MPTRLLAGGVADDGDHVGLAAPDVEPGEALGPPAERVRRTVAATVLGHHLRAGVAPLAVALHAQPQGPVTEVEPGDDAAGAVGDAHLRDQPGQHRPQEQAEQRLGGGLGATVGHSAGSAEGDGSGAPGAGLHELGQVDVGEHAPVQHVVEQADHCLDRQQSGAVDHGAAHGGDPQPAGQSDEVARADPQLTAAQGASRPVRQDVHDRAPR